MPHRYAPALAFLAAVTALVLTPGPVPAATRTPSVQEQIDAHLAAYPGGKQIGPTEISYAGGRFVMTFVRSDAAIAASDCPGGWFCFYDQISYGYPRGKLSDCGWQDLANWGWQNRTESVSYALATGSVSFINHLSANHSSDHFMFAINPAVPNIPDIAPYRNMADHVYRFC